MKGAQLPLVTKEHTLNKGIIERKCGIMGASNTYTLILANRSRLNQTKDLDFCLIQMEDCDRNNPRTAIPLIFESVKSTLKKKYNRLLIILYV